MLQPFPPLRFGEVKPVRWQRFVRCAATGLVERILARLVIVGDLREPLVRGVLGERLDRNRRRVEIIEQRLEALVEQGQPMLEAGGPAALAHRFVEHVIGPRRAEGRDIAGAKQPDGVGGELEFRHRYEIERAQLLARALRFGIEAADRFQRVAEKIEPHRRIHARREQIDDAAAHRIVAGFAHRGGAIESIQFEPLGHARHRQQIARRGGKRLPGKRLARRHALEERTDRGEHDGRPLAALDPREPRQRHHALRDHRRMRRDPVVGQAIPSRKLEHLDVRCEKGERARQHRHARAVAANDGKADRRRRRAGRDRARQVGDDQPFGAIGDTGEKERPARLKALRRRLRQ